LYYYKFAFAKDFAGFGILQEACDVVADIQ
jgi:hypothetical protein